jgi:hypothetical protein
MIEDCKLMICFIIKHNRYVIGERHKKYAIGHYLKILEHIKRAIRLELMSLMISIPDSSFLKRSKEALVKTSQ